MTRYQYFSRVIGAYTPNLWAWRMHLVTGAPCRLNRAGVLSRGTYSFVKHVERPGGAPSYLSGPWAIVNNGERDLKPVPITYLVPANRNHAIRTGQPSQEMV